MLLKIHRLKLTLLSHNYVPLMLIVGVTTFWPIADGMLLWYFYKKRNVTFSWFTVALLVIGVVNGLLNLHLLPVMWAIRIVLVYSLMRGYRLERNSSAHILFMLVLGIQMYAMLANVMWGISRPFGLSLNALLAADMGFAFIISPSWGIAAVIIALSGSRSVMLAVGLLALFSWNRKVWYVAFVTGIMFVMFVGNFTPERLSLSGIRNDVELRTATFSNGLQLNDECGPIRDPEFTGSGYGVGLYCNETGRQGPHNVFVMSAYSLGVLAVPFWLILFMRFSYRWYYAMPAILAIGMLTDDLFSRPEGVYVLAIFSAHYMMYFGTRDFRDSSVECSKEQGCSPLRVWSENRW